MKTMKRIGALIFALILALSMTVTAFADEDTNAKNDYKITISKTSSSHSYEAYQILAGDLAADKATLSNVKWGSGVDASKLDVKDAAEYAKELAKIESKSAAADAEAAKLGSALVKDNAYTKGSFDKATETYTLTGLPAGYYLIKDTDKENYGDNTTATLYILAVVGDAEVTAKAGKVTVEKKVKDINDSTDDAMTDWQDSADYDIGDVIPFQWTGTLPDNYADFKEFSYEFCDTQSKGLTFNNNFKVYAVNGDTKTEIAKDFYTVSDAVIDKDGNTLLNIKFDDLKKVESVNKSTKIVVEYTSTLNEDAVLGSAGNPNDVLLKFSNNPNGDGTGETPKDRVIVFTYKVVVDKIDQDKKPLAGAEFTLYKLLNDGSQVALSTVVTKEGTEFSFVGLDDGKYLLKETKTPDGYNTINDITFEVVADHVILADSPELKSLNGNKITGEIEFKADLAQGTLQTEVVNQKGSILPSTGGAGRVALYVVGAILVLGVGVVSVAKIRARQ